MAAAPMGGTGTTAEVFLAFLRLGFTAFGGPVAHLAWFRAEFVERRRWMDAAPYARLVALCQALPGPASSQLGFALGLQRAGWRGALAAFTAFTLPSALLMASLVATRGWLSTAAGAAVVHGLALVAVAVVGHGVARLARSTLRGGGDVAVALLAAAAVLGGRALGAPPVLVQLLTLAGAALAGAALDAVGWLRPAPVAAMVGAWPLAPVSRRAAVTALVMATAGTALAVAWPPHAPGVSPGGAPGIAALAAACWRAGALVFGGGHVVLPLLEAAVVESGWMAREPFVAAYGAAQAIPGPLFSVAAFIGAAVPTGVPAAVGAAVAVLALFTPGFLVLVAALPVWSALEAHPSAARALAGVQAGVVGLLAAAFVDPVWRVGVRHPGDLAIAAVGVLLVMRFARAAPLVVAWCVGASLVTSSMGW